MTFELFRELREENNKQSMKLFLDLDGVFADFDQGVQDLFDTTPDQLSKNQMFKGIGEQMKRGIPFFYNLPLMEDAMILWNFVNRYQNIAFLTSTGETQPEYVEQQKKQWVQENFGNYEVNTVLRGAKKAEFVLPDALSILIDDKTKCIDPWIENGGTGIVHTSATDSIDHLREIVNEHFNK